MPRNAVRARRFGLVGTVTSDRIVYERGPIFQGLGGILYQTAVLCGLGEEVVLIANVGAAAWSDLEIATAAWSTLRKEGLRAVPGPGNRVNLFYPLQGERREVLDYLVPPLEPERISKSLPGLDFLIFAVNSGFDMSQESWSSVKEGFDGSLWLDIHSLALSPVLGSPRDYLPLPQWEAWSAGVDYLQANLQEVACMVGHPERLPDEAEIEDFGRKALSLGTRAVFVTLGGEGVLVQTSEGFKRVPPPGTGPVIDTTGCGDVFCAGAASRLARGESPLDAASFGLRLASRATGVIGVEAAFSLAEGFSKEALP